MDIENITQPSAFRAGNPQLVKICLQQYPIHWENHWEKRAGPRWGDVSAFPHQGKHAVSDKTRARACSGIFSRPAEQSNQIGGMVVSESCVARIFRVIDLN